MDQYYTHTYQHIGIHTSVYFLNNNNFLSKLTHFLSFSFLYKLLHIYRT